MNSNSPYSTFAQSTAPTLSMDVSDQYRSHKKDEELAKSSINYPFTFSSSMEIIAQIYERLIYLKQIIESSDIEMKRHAKLPQEKDLREDAVEKVSELIDDINKKVTIDLPEYLEHFKF